MTLKDIVHIDPDILGGTPVFVGTRVPVRILLDYLEGGEPLEVPRQLREREPPAGNLFS